jgi:hypothetical protein
LVSQDEDGKVWLSYNTPAYMQSRHGLPTELMANISVIGTLVAFVAE